MMLNANAIQFSLNEEIFAYPDIKSLCFSYTVKKCHSSYGFPIYWCEIFNLLFIIL